MVADKGVSGLLLEEAAVEGRIVEGIVVVGCFATEELLLVDRGEKNDVILSQPIVVKSNPKRSRALIFFVKKKFFKPALF